MDDFKGFAPTAELLSHLNSIDRYRRYLPRKICVCGNELESQKDMRCPGCQDMVDDLIRACIPKVG